MFFDLFYPQRPQPTFDLTLTYFNSFWGSGPLGGLSLLNTLPGPPVAETQRLQALGGCPPSLERIPKTISSSKMEIGMIRRPRFGSVRLRFRDGTVQAVPVFSVLAVPL